MFVGSCFGCIYGLVNCVVSVYLSARENKVSFRTELLDEIRFILQCSGNTKAVKYPKNSSRSNASSKSKGSSMSVDSLPEDNSEADTPGQHNHAK
ncbi:uncharacterized protein Dyak_GE27873 [Drosophila yakuba]|uniref:Uncharacterized protein n=1 Tax=Drosophila yakuba TaxID=7245 RepID=A0A0R1EE06_DROYA|nr:uncharacterized protein Dyak_GE27873 [Drosophila yakuba]